MTRNLFAGIAVFTLSAIYSTAPAIAATIDYTFSGFGRGALGSNEFGDINGVFVNVPFVVELVGNTGIVIGPNPAGFFTNSVTATFTSGALSATFLGTRFVEADSLNVNFVQQINNAENIMSLRSGVLNGYDLTTAINVGNLMGPDLDGLIFQTDQGILSFTRIDTDFLTFKAVIPAAETPLPGALPLFATGLGAMGLLGWRRKRKAASESV